MDPFSEFPAAWNRLRREFGPSFGEPFPHRHPFARMDRDWPFNRCTCDHSSPSRQVPVERDAKIERQSPQPRPNLHSPARSSPRASPRPTERSVEVKVEPRTASPKPKTEPKPQVKTEPKPQDKPEPQVKTEPKPEVKTERPVEVKLEKTGPANTKEAPRTPSPDYGEEIPTPDDSELDRNTPGMKITVIHGVQRYELDLPNPNLDSELSDFYKEMAAETSGEMTYEWTVMRLKKQIQQLTDVRTSDQRLILRGRTLNDDNASLASLKLKEGDKILLLGSKMAVQESETSKKLGRMEQETVTGLKTDIAAAEKELDSLAEAKDRAPGKKALDKKFKFINEGCMKALLAMDGLQVDGDAERKRRKAVVLQVQELLNLHDRLVEKLATVDK